ncbi:hypothetical protein VNO77_41973 [Canavalia gladiata]|uniref:Uncharacterized protein n=1 Tax=Canavalia gladiata TaxID=3824 RepID=A0AAN9JZU5_CANGL
MFVKGVHRYSEILQNFFATIFKLQLREVSVFLKSSLNQVDHKIEFLVLKPSQIQRPNLKKTANIAWVQFLENLFPIIDPPDPKLHTVIDLALSRLVSSNYAYKDTILAGSAPRMSPSKHPGSNRQEAKTMAADRPQHVGSSRDIFCHALKSLIKGPNIGST